MEGMQSIKSTPPWYLPAVVSKWCRGEKCPPLSRLAVENRPESLVVEEVDFSFLDSFFAEAPEAPEIVEAPEIEDDPQEIDSLVLDCLIVESPPEAITPPAVEEEQEEEQEEHPTDDTPPMISVDDVMAAISGFADIPTPNVRVGGESSELIDRFLQRKDYRIVALNEPVEQSFPPSWDGAPDTTPHLFGDDTASEELAQIYLSQGLYHEAKEIYTRLFLLYSEKSVYFARQIGKIPSTPPENRNFGRKSVTNARGKINGKTADAEHDSSAEDVAGEVDM